MLFLYEIYFLNLSLIRLYLYYCATLFRAPHRLRRWITEEGYIDLSKRVFEIYRERGMHI
jgi:hypothetical protein